MMCPSKAEVGMTGFFVTMHHKGGNRTLSRPKGPSFRQISFHKFGDALFGSFDRIEQILQRLASFKPLICKYAVQYIGVSFCHGCRIGLFRRLISQETEPPRVCRRPQLLRGWGHGNDQEAVEQIFT